MLFIWKNTHVQSDFGDKVLNTFGTYPWDFFEQFQRIFVRRKNFFYPLVQASDGLLCGGNLLTNDLEHVHMVFGNKPLASLEDFFFT